MLHKTKNYVAIIDIGSNAVRLVVYDAADRAPVKIHNERNICRLGADLGVTGALNPDGVRKALSSIRRFSGLLQAMKIKQVRAVATAAVRDASDGAAFIAKIKKEFGLAVEVIDGDDEARLSALGVLANGLGNNGLIGDYGGGSLELILVKSGKVAQKTSLPLGSHRLLAELTRAARIKKIDAALDSVAFLEQCKGIDFYALGGAWRSLGRAHMMMSKHPLVVLDHYAVTAKKAHEFAGLISRQSRASLEKTPGLSKKRVEDMSVAALAMERLFDKISPSRLIFSGTGLREGLLYTQLKTAQQKQDPLVASALKVARRISRFDDIGGFKRLMLWMAPLFEDEDPQIARYLEASCLLSDTGWFEHEDYQAEHAFERILVMPFYGIDHRGRVFLALAQYVRYQGDFFVAASEKTPDHIARIVRKTLDEKDRHLATRMGLLLRMGYLLTGGALSLLKDASFKLTPKKLVLSLRKDADMLNAHVIDESLTEVARMMGRGAVVQVEQN